MRLSKQSEVSQHDTWGIYHLFLFERAKRQTIPCLSRMLYPFLHTITPKNKNPVPLYLRDEIRSLYWSYCAPHLRSRGENAMHKKEHTTVTISKKGPGSFAGRAVSVAAYYIVEEFRLFLNENGIETIILLSLIPLKAIQRAVCGEANSLSRLITFFSLFREEHSRGLNSVKTSIELLLIVRRMLRQAT